MEGRKKLITETLFIKNMISNCCIILLRERLQEEGIVVHDIRLGSVMISYDPGKIPIGKIHLIIRSIGLDIIHSREKQLVEQIKTALIELIHYMNNVDSIARKADYLVEKLGYSYQYLSRLFSAHETITLERYIILQKIERIKELVFSGEFTLSEIAYMMDYSSVQYLSAQFKKITGFSVSDFKEDIHAGKNPLDKLY
jgi:AraC-like DNA-binding protein